MFTHVPIRHEILWHGQMLSLETGLLAKQSTRTVLAKLGETTVLATIMVGGVSGVDYLPLQVMYEERMYASGKIKGSRFIKREGRPSDQAVLTGRMVDRSLRSLINDNVKNDIQVIITVLSLDEINQPDTLAVIAASAALRLCNLQNQKDEGESVFAGPVSSVRLVEEPLSIGDQVIAQMKPRIESAQSLKDLESELSEVSQLFDQDVIQDQNHIREFFSLLGRKNPQWAAEYRTTFDSTKKLSQSKIQLKYGLDPLFVTNPNYPQTQTANLEIIASGSQKNIVMIEAFGHIVREEVVISALEKAQSELALINEFQNDFCQKVFSAESPRPTYVTTTTRTMDSYKIWKLLAKNLEAVAFSSESKLVKNAAIKEFKNSITSFIKEYHGALETDRPSIESKLEQEVEALCKQWYSSLGEDIDIVVKDVPYSFDEIYRQIVKYNLLFNNRRLDGRTLDQVRPILPMVSVLPRTHGSSLFQRGETQVLNVLTLGTLKDAQTLDDMEDFEERNKRYIHHYNFPSYSVGETGRYGPPKRREIGHGALAEKALLPVLPSESAFPYTIRLVSECLESNGSTSMASTCASCLSLMDAGVPIKEMVAGVAMGLVLDHNTQTYRVITDIQGAEDHYGDMDFKITGTHNGITAIQLDNKAAGLTMNILADAIIQAKQGRVHILGEMSKALSQPRSDLSPYAPRVLNGSVPIEKIGDIIGPGGKTIKALILKYHVEIDIDDDGGVFVYSKEGGDAHAALAHILNLVREFKAEDVVTGKVFRVEAYGAFIKINDSEKEGMIHISEMAAGRVAKVEDIMNKGDVVTAKIVSINEKGQISLTIKGVEQKKYI